MKLGYCAAHVLPLALELLNNKGGWFFESGSDGESTLDGLLLNNPVELSLLEQSLLLVQTHFVCLLVRGRLLVYHLGVMVANARHRGIRRVITSGILDCC